MLDKNLLDLVKPQGSLITRQPKLSFPNNKKTEEVLLEFVVRNLAKTVDAFLIHNQVPAIGSIVYCNLALAFEHTGIYVGNNKIVHLNGNGRIEKVSFQKFIERLDGNNLSFSIFCAVDKNGESIGSNKIAERALKMVGLRRDYNVAIDNCHRFTNYCLTGKNSMITSFTMLEEELKLNYGFANWRAIDMS